MQTLPSYYRIIGFNGTDVTLYSEVYGVAKTWEEAEAMQEEAENLGWTLVRIQEIGAVHK